VAASRRSVGGTGPERGGTCQHDHRHAARCRRDRDRVRCPPSPGGRCAPHDAQRHRIVDAADRNDTAFGRHDRVSTVGLGHPQLAGRVIQPLARVGEAWAVGRHQQGAVIGLRQTGQRLTRNCRLLGVSESFFILGALMLLLCTPLAPIIRRIGRFRSAGRATVGGAAD
jgi:hypothetical protein